MTLRLVKLPTRRSLRASHEVGLEPYRMLTIVGLHLDGELGVTAGWGECSALNQSGYTSEWAEGAFDQLHSPKTVSIDTAPMAFSAIETALIDATLKSRGESLASSLGTAGSSSVAGAVIGLGTIDSMLAEVASVESAGYRRVKLKIAPERITAPIRTIRSHFPALEIQVDANGSLASADLHELCGLSDLGVTVVEQPFSPLDSESARLLVQDSDLTVAADESVGSLADVNQLVSTQTANAVIVKPAKVGGLHQGLSIIDRAQELGASVAIGGMLESGLGRSLLAAVGPLDGIDLVGDLSPASQWLAQDPFTDLSMVEGSVMAPSAVGIAGAVDLESLDHHTVASSTINFELTDAQTRLLAQSLDSLNKGR